MTRYVAGRLLQSLLLLLLIVTAVFFIFQVIDEFVSCVNRIRSKSDFIVFIFAEYFKSIQYRRCTPVTIEAQEWNG
jgi:lipopolysaccharide export LptBFGC system permease protein LptF